MSHQSRRAEACFEANAKVTHPTLVCDGLKGITTVFSQPSFASSMRGKRVLSSAGGGQPYAFRDENAGAIRKYIAFFSVFYFAKKIDEITMVLEPFAL